LIKKWKKKEGDTHIYNVVDYVEKALSLLVKKVTLTPSFFLPLPLNFSANPFLPLPVRLPVNQVPPFL